MAKDKKKIILNRTKDGKHVNIFLIFTMIIVMAVLSLGSLAAPDRDKSDNENRFLTQKPKFSVENVLEGKFETQLEDYLSDQIVGRENWIKIMSSTLNSVGYSDVNGVYILDDGRLIERKTQAEFNSVRFKNNLEQIAEMNEEVSKSGAEVRVMLIPTAAHSYRNLANLSTNFDEEEAFIIARDTLGDILIDLEDSFVPDDNASDGYYYKTDHHWNYFGAEKGAAIYRDSLGLKQRDWEAEELTKDFKGTLYSKVLLSERVRDTISVPGDSVDMDVKVSIGDERYDSVYFMDRLENKDKYEVFLGGNYEKVDIYNEEPGAEDKPRLMIVKDSYANSFVPFIMDDFSLITMVDTRYFRQSVKDAVLDGEYDQVLVLYSVSNFSEEKMSLNSSLLT